jgi:hAT family C-terminal dimerisation region
MKLMRQVLDHLHNTYDEYQKVLSSKLLFFHNLVPGRLKHFSLPEAEKLIEIVSGITSASMLHTELQLLQATIDNCSGMSELARILESIGAGYPNASLLYTFLLTLPITVASNERGFSKMKLLKNRLRSTLTAEKFENLMLCAVEKDVLDAADLSVLADEWAATKKRRIVISTKHLPVS